MSKIPISKSDRVLRSATRTKLNSNNPEIPSSNPNMIRTPPTSRIPRAVSSNRTFQASSTPIPSNILREEINIHQETDQLNVENEIEFLRQRLNILTANATTHPVHQVHINEDNVSDSASNFSSVHESHSRENHAYRRAPNSRYFLRRDSSNSSIESFPTSRRNRNETHNCQIHKWPIRFNGSDVKTFLKKIKCSSKFLWIL